MAYDNSADLRDERDDWMHYAKDLRRAFCGDGFDQRLPGFTQYESQMLKLFARHPFVRYEQIVEALRKGPMDLGPTPGSVKTMISRMRRKLEAMKFKGGISCVWGSGWYATDQKAMQRLVDKLSPVQTPLNNVEQIAA